ncbi:helix-turn-helix domain-containing protein [Paenibacillus sp. EZ-K15]|uniref:winged helix-turn-helix domain-containing protein n=1 Tax=unclassified Paenibacillus TaxID=185978 RepID=UPI000BF66906|nr:helix-turn-helix domain-containing protein [Paenibacillus sp. EZ-K15]MBT2759679.1 helix-turn-helix transcriptional regulator [Paenibacillus sp. ISL-20]
METKELTTLEEIKIYSDPYRLQILNVLNKMDRPATVKEVADNIGDVPAKVHYHMKKLERIGMVKIVSTKEINGIIAKYYEPFVGTVKIKRGANSEEPVIKELIRTETNKLLSELFDQNRDRFFKNMSQEGETTSMLTNTTLYMSEEEAREFFVELDKMLTPYKKKRGEGYDEYEFFASNVRTHKES